MLNDLRSDVNQRNRVDIYGSKDWEQAKQFIATMIDKARNNQQKEEERHGSEPIKVEGLISTWKLVTKYYQATLEIRLLSDHLLTNQLESYSTEDNNKPLATVILWDTQDKDQLSTVLSSFSTSDSCGSESRLLVVQIDPDSLEEDHEWHEICFEYGFECHSAFELDEASMSWQCCPWSTIQMTKKQTAVGSSEVDPSMSFDEWSPAANNTLEEMKHPSDQEDSFEENGFDDDFSPFVSADSSCTEWDYTTLSDHDHDEDESELVDRMTRQLFGHSSDLVCETDLHSLVSRIDQLRVHAASLDFDDRQRLAANVALALQNHLGSHS